MVLKQGGSEGENLSDKTLRKFVNTVGENLEDILDLIHADNISHSAESSMPNQINNVRSRIKKLESDLDGKGVKLPINGNDLIAMGLKPSALFREIMAAVQNAWYENPNLTRDEALEIVKRFKIKDDINEIKILMKKLI